MTNKSWNYILKQCYITIWKVEKYTDSKNPKVVKTKKKRMFLSKCALCDSKKLKFTKEQETRG